jgi:hypothetical protein
MVLVVGMGRVVYRIDNDSEGGYFFGCLKAARQCIDEEEFADTCSLLI